MSIPLELASKHVKLKLSFVIYSPKPGQIFRGSAQENSARPTAYENNYGNPIKIKCH